MLQGSDTEFADTEFGCRIRSVAAILAPIETSIELATTPIQVTLISDEETQVTVYRVGDLGSFASLDVALQPGRYTAVGQRRGYYDVRATFTVLPGDEVGPITIICSERI